MAASLDRGSYGVSIRLHSYQRLCKTLPPHLILARNQRSERVLCQAVALPQGMQYWLDEVSAYIFRRPQKVRLLSVSSGVITVLQPVSEDMTRLSSQMRALCEILHHVSSASKGCDLV